MSNEKAFVRSVDGRETPLHEGEICIYWTLEDYTDVFQKSLYEMPASVDASVAAGDVEVITI